MSPLAQLVPRETDRASPLNFVAQAESPVDPLYYPPREPPVALVGDMAELEPPAEPVDAPPLSTERDLRAVWRAAADAVRQSTDFWRLDELWRNHVRGRLCSWRENVRADRILLVSRLASSLHRSAGESAIDADDASVLARVFCGEAQKALASELGLSASTVSGRYQRALAILDLDPHCVPLALILGAQAAAGVRGTPRARSAFFERERQMYLVSSIRRPVLGHVALLTGAEQEVAQWIIEGCSRLEVARRRRTSVYTVNRQVSRVYGALRQSGRFALVRHAVQLDCFANRLARVARARG